MKKILLIVIPFLIYSCSENTDGPNRPALETEWIKIDAGPYTYGEQNTRRNVDYDFYIMKFEVTNLQYINYLNAALNSGLITVTKSGVEGRYEDENIEAGNYRFYNFGNYLSNPERYNFGKIFYSGGKFSVSAGYENHPVVLVTYYGACAFAEYYGLRLPDEDEWEKAARGNTGRTYSWGDSLHPARGNYYLDAGSSSDPFEPGTTPAGFYNGQIHGGFQTVDSPSPFGAYDMTGNAFEWTDSYSTFPEFDRIIRGGSWSFADSYWLYSWYRHNHSPGFSCEYIGFRCVK